MNCFSHLDLFACQTAVITDSGTRYSYAELIRAADSIGSIVKDRSLVFSLCSNTIPSLCGYVGFLRHAIVPVLLDVNLNKDLLESLLKIYKPAYIWLPEANKEQFWGMETVHRFDNYLLLKTGYDDSYPLHPDLGLLLTTSGSTGSPKLVRQSYANIKANTESICTYLDITSDDRPITTLPMSYTYGLSILNSHLYKGATILMTEKTMMEKDFWQFLKKEKATTFGGVPYSYQMLKRLRFFKMELPSLKYLTQAGGKLSYGLTKEIVEHCESKGIKFIVMYGQTEATARMSYLPSEYALSKCGSMGVAIPGGEFWLQDEDGQLIKESDVVGELVYRGDNVTLGYAECGEDLAKGDERNGILITGDMAKRDADGFYYIVGRKKRFVKIFGSRVNLDEAERLLFSQGYTCACAGIDDQMSVFTENKGREEDILHYLAATTHLNMSAFKVRYIESIPKNEAGKTLYTELEKL